MSRQNLPAIFLDRDGVINVEVEYLHKPEDVMLTPSCGEAIACLNQLHIPVIVVTNQAGIGRGYYTEQDMCAVHGQIDQLLSRAGAHIDCYYYCPHHPTAGIGAYRTTCTCRKPQPGMLLQAAKDLSIDLKRSYIIGDKLSDLEAGYQVGCKGILVLTGYGKQMLTDKAAVQQFATFVAKDIYQAVHWCLYTDNINITP